MPEDFFTYIGYTFVWCCKVVVIPFGVALSARIVAEKILRRPQPERQRKKRLK
jgi:heme exporter protein D